MITPSSCRLQNHVPKYTVYFNKGPVPLIWTIWLVALKWTEESHIYIVLNLDISIRRHFSMSLNLSSSFIKRNYNVFHETQSINFNVTNRRNKDNDGDILQVTFLWLVVELSVLAKDFGPSSSTKLFMSSI